MTTAPAPLRWAWARFLPRARIGTRIVAAVVCAMAVVLVASGAFVFWRISFALDRQLDQDLAAYDRVVRSAVAADEPLPTGTPGLVAEVYDADGTVVASTGPTTRLLDAGRVRAATDAPRRRDTGRLLPPPERTPYRVTSRRVVTDAGPRVVASAISRRHHDEALRELLGQLLLVDLAAMLAAGVVGWGAARAVLGPVERYREAASDASGEPGARLPVPDGRDDELARLGRTVNDLLQRIDDGRRRERQLLADASHELRSPLALLAAEVEWARHRPRTGAELDEVFASLSAQVSGLAALADALLRLEEADGSDAARRDVGLDVLVDAAVAPHLPRAEALGRDVVVRAPTTVVRVEEQWMVLAVGNLVANALAHGRGAVTVTARADGATASVEVVDEGGGIPASLGAAAFERFARADEARRTPGHGLGLALVAAVARRHSGSAAAVPGGVVMRIDVS